MKRNTILHEWIKVLRYYLTITTINRHSKTNRNYVEFICDSPIFEQLSGRLNDLRDAESCGYWIMVRPQKSAKKAVYQDHQVYQLFLTPVHPHKKYVAKVLAAAALDFTPIESAEKRMDRHIRQKLELVHV